MRKVYITGLGFVTSIGNDKELVTSSLRELRHGFELYPPFQRPEVPVKLMGTVKGFDVSSIEPEDWVFPECYSIRRELIRSMAPHGLYAHCAMVQALADAGLSNEDVRDGDTGLYCASGGSPMMLSHYMRRMHELGVMRCSPVGVVSSIAGTLNFNLVAAFKIRGHSCGFSSACASSGHALGFAFDDIATGRQERMIVVGAEDGNTDAILPFAAMRALSLERDPALASRPFDAARDGFVGTGGAAVLVLESEDSVAARGVQPYARVAGWGQASDGHNVAISHPEGVGLADAMRRALRSAKVTPEEVDYVNAHATSTTIGDASEVSALRTVFGKEVARIPISSTKALTGHGLSMASALESGICSLAIRQGFVPGCGGLRTVDPDFADLNFPRQTLDVAPKIILNNASGFGGANVSIVMRSVDS